MHIRGILRIDVRMFDHTVGYKNIKIDILVINVDHLYRYILARRSLAPNILMYINKGFPGH